MKKLLSAVTSVLMASSFVTSAFASSFNVSAAGGVSAVQPNVSMEEVVDGAANKYAVQNDFVVTGSEETYNAGGSNIIKFTVESGGHKGAMIGFEIGSLPAGITAEPDPYCYAFDDMPGWTVLGDQWSCQVQDPTSQDPRSFIDGNIIVAFNLNVPTNIKDGTYEIGMDYFHVVEQGHELKGDIVEFDAKVVPGKLIVGDGGSTTPTSGGSSSGNVQNDFVITGSKETYKAGETPIIKFTVESGGHKGAMLGFEVGNLPAGITAEPDPYCYAFDDMPGWTVLGEQWSCQVQDPTSQDPRSFNDGQIVVALNLTVPANIAEGTYNIGMEYFHVVEQGHELKGDIVEFDAKIVPGQLIVGEGGSTTPPSQGGEVQNDFVVTGSEETYKAGETPIIKFTVESGGHKGAMIAFVIGDLPAGITAEPDPYCYAFDDMPGWSVLGEQWSCQVQDPTSQDPRAFNDGQIIVAFNLNVPANIAEGTYNIGMEYFHVVEQGHELKGDIIEFDAKVVPGKLIVGGSTAPSETETPDDFLISGSTLVFTKGDDYTKNNVMNFTVEPGNHKGATLSFEIDTLPAGIKAEVDPFCYAFDNTPAWELYGDSYIAHTRNDVEEPQSFKNNGIVTSFKLTIPSDIAVGEYEIDLSNFHVVEQGSEAAGTIVEFDSKVVPGKVIIKEASSTVDPTDPPADPAEGEAVWEIGTVTGTPGESVDVPVYVKGNSTLEVAGATFEITANGASFNKVTGPCPAYGIAAITNNGKTNEFAFAQGKGQGSAAADQAVIMTLTYDVPADAKGTIPVEWANVTVSDTNGNLITSKVKVQNGAIIISDTPVADGEALWVIDTVTGTPGESVDVPVYVKGTSTLEVAGATFEITANGAGFNKVTGPCAAYGNAAITNNAKTNEFAFAQADGKGSAAADQAVIMTLTYDVPADATGTIPVEWANVVVSDTNGNLITEKVKVENGAIIIDVPTTEATSAPTTEAPDVPTTAAPTTEGSDTPITTVPTTEVSTPATTSAPILPEEGEAVWVIDTVHGKPGETITVPVFVQGDTILEVAGATFTVNAEGVGFNNVSDSCAAYGNAAIVNNADTSEYAFAQADGKGSAAADQAVIMNITYDVPANATGTIPVTWANVVVSDTDGNLITDKVILVNGAIIIDTPETTTPPVSEVTTAAPTTDAPDVPTTAAPTTDAPDVPTTAAPTTDAPEVPTTAAPTTAGGSDVPTTAAPTTAGGSDVPTTAAPTTEAPDVPTTAAPTTEAPQSGTTVTIQPGSIIWQGETVTATPGQKVELSFVVNDPNNAQLVIGGANFTIDSEGNLVLVDGNGSDAYGSGLDKNLDTKEFAFASPKGEGTAAPNGSKVITLTFEVPADAKDGDTFNIGMSNLVVSDANGNIISDKVLVIDGKIVVTVPVTTEPPVSEVTTAPTTAGGSDVPTTAAPTTAGGSDVPTTAAPTTDAPDVPTTAAPTTDAPDVPTTAAPTTDAPDVPTTAAPTTDAPDVPTTEAPTTASSDIVTTTTNAGQVGPGSDVTTTVTKDPIASGDADIPVTVVDGYFFSHDPRPFPAEMVIAKYVEDENGIADFDPSKVTFEDTVNGGSTPMAAYRESQTDFTYKLNVFYDGKPLYLEDGTRAVVTAYIGVKGDSNLDNKVDSSDATNVLAYYAAMMTGGNPETTRITPAENAIVNAHPELDVLCKFLADVDLDCYSKDNWNLKHNRTIASNDASWILTFFANVMTSNDLAAYDNWIMTLGGSYKESFEDYSQNGTIFDAE